MKTKEELNALINEVETLNKKLAELSEDELKQITGGYGDWRTHNGADILQTTKPEQAFVNPKGEQMLSDTGGYSTVTDEDVFHEMKLPDFNLN